MWRDDLRRLKKLRSVLLILYTWASYELHRQQLRTLARIACLFRASRRVAAIHNTELRYASPQHLPWPGTLRHSVTDSKVVPRMNIQMWIIKTLSDRTIVQNVCLYYHGVRCLVIVVVSPLTVTSCLQLRTLRVESDSHTGHYSHD